jgi:4'-phosphopantetheinyl transferase
MEELILCAYRGCPSLASLALTIELDALATEVHIWRAELSARALPAAAVLRQVLARYLDEEPTAIELRLGKHGKPALAEWPPRLHFNLSHSGGLALIAVTRDCEVGIDIECKKEGRDFVRLARRVLEGEPAEAVYRAHASERAAIFYAAWVRREAIAKCFGSGLGAPLPSRSVSLHEIAVGDGHAAALALAAPAVLPIRRFSFSPA